jgi:hypothetical protein
MYRDDTTFFLLQRFSTLLLVHLDPVFPRVIVIRSIFFLRHHPRRHHRPARRSSVLAHVSFCGSSAPPERGVDPASVDWISRRVRVCFECFFFFILRCSGVYGDLCCVPLGGGACGVWVRAVDKHVVLF